MSGGHISFARCVLNGRLGRVFAWCSAIRAGSKQTCDRRTAFGVEIVPAPARQCGVGPGQSGSLLTRLRGFVGGGLLERAGIGCLAGGVSGIVVRCSAAGVRKGVGRSPPGL